MIIQTSSFENRNDQMIRIWLDLLVVLKKCAAHLEGFATAHDLFHIHLLDFSQTTPLLQVGGGVYLICANSLSRRVWLSFIFYPI